jgi:RNase H-fold protein (predicted Holliday junction resolvase)
MNDNRIWSEFRADYEEDGFLFIDAYQSENDDEIGKTIAKIDLRNQLKVIYLDERAKTDKFAQEFIEDVKLNE